MVISEKKFCTSFSCKTIISYPYCHGIVFLNQHVHRILRKTSKIAAADYEAQGALGFGVDGKLWWREQ